MAHFDLGFRRDRSLSELGTLQYEETVEAFHHKLSKVKTDIENICDYVVKNPIGLGNVDKTIQKINQHSNDYKTLCDKFMSYLESQRTSESAEESEKQRQCMEALLLKINKKLLNGHACGVKTQCRICKKLVTTPYLCFVQMKSKPKCNKELKMYIYYDFECTQENGIHTHNLCMAERVCQHCDSLDINTRCEHCQVFGSQRRFVFQGPDTLKQFMDWLLQSETAEKGNVTFKHDETTASSHPEVCIIPCYPTRQEENYSSPYAERAPNIAT
ncbi:uncharacterized protein LOC130050759 [Ostrea edulis]|uniref:uncharacterized protein LOC130050759 n=1 Tax=Ostrea edulis TaxID=37623 RepID=UPI0024AEF82D|nr:uncharacterized protein LOC130050759 [Ostrea edulis]